MFTPAIRATPILLGNACRGATQSLIAPGPGNIVTGGVVSTRRHQILVIYKRLRQDAVDLPAYLFDIRHPVHPAEQTEGLIVRQDRRGLAMVGLEPRHHRLAIVVGTAGELVGA